MAYKQYYGGAIWTNHAIDRMRDRGLTQEQAWVAFRNPDSQNDGKNKGSKEFKKKIGESLVTLIANQNEKKEWIVISAWIDPPLPGSSDFKKNQQYKEYKNASFLRKFWISFLRQVGF